MAEFLELGPRETAAFRAAMLEVRATAAEARKRAERARREIDYNPADPRSVAQYRAGWAKYLEERSAALGPLDRVLGPSTRHRMFRAQGARWIYYLDSHRNGH